MSGGGAESSSSIQLPWQAIPHFIPGTTDVTEYSGKLKFLAAMWPKEHLALLAPRAALLTEGTAFKKVAKIDAEKLKSSDDSGVRLLVSTLGGSWGKTALEEKYDCFEKAIYGTLQKSDESNDSYLARHDVHFEELLLQGTTLEEVRAYILLRQSQLSSEDRKKIVVEMGGTLKYEKVCSAIRLLGSRFFSDLQGQRTARTKVYDANLVEEPPLEDFERAYHANAPGPAEEIDGELDQEYIDALVAADDPDAAQIQVFEDELETFFQDVPDLQDALVSYLEARNRLQAKKRSRGFWPIGSSQKGFKGNKGSKGGGKGKTKGAKEQLLARIAKSHCRLCGERGHWKAECPRKSSAGPKTEATTTMAEVLEDASLSEAAASPAPEILTTLPEEALSLEEAHFAEEPPKLRTPSQNIRDRLSQIPINLKKRLAKQESPSRPTACGETALTEPPAGRKPLSVDRSSPEHRRPGSWYLPKIPEVAYAHEETIEAIVDTGASRCVMGKQLLSTFLSQLSQPVRQLVRVARSSVRFRFGNNQTLESEKRILLPIRAGLSHVLWLSIEIVPGRTPLLFSKRAIKQLGGVIDTVQDRIHLKRLNLSRRLRTGPTGLYMLDLTELCEENSRPAECQHASEDSLSAVAPQPPEVHALGSEKEGCTASGCIDDSGSPRPLSLNSSSGGELKLTASDNDAEQSPLRDSVSHSCHACDDASVPSEAELPSSPVITDVDPCTRSYSDPKQHGPELQPRRFLHTGSRHAAGPVAGPHTVLHHSPDGGHGCERTRSLSDRFRSKVCRQDLCRGSGGFPRLGKVVLRPPQGLPEAEAPRSPHLHPQVCGAGREDRDRAASQLSQRSAKSDQAKQGHSQGQGRWEEQGLLRGRALGRDRSGRFRRGGSGECPRWPRGSTGPSAERAHGTNGADHATGAGSNPGAPCVSETLVSEFLQCRKELQEALQSTRDVTATVPPFSPEDLESKARELLQQQVTVKALKSFLRTVPWHTLAKATHQSVDVPADPTDASFKQEPAYLMFGSFRHGGVKGVTRVSKAYPWLTKVLTRTLRETDPNHTFTSIGVSCNTKAPPHRDVHNVPGTTNLIVPLSYPVEGGEVWSAKKAQGRQKELSVECGNKSVQGSLQSLKCPTYVCPHTWHATMPWQGDRVILIGFSLKTSEELSASDAEWLQLHGFPQVKSPASAQLASTPEGPLTCLRDELQKASVLLQPSNIASQASSADDACVDAFARAEEVAWATLQDSQLKYGIPAEQQLDLLEIHAPEDSQLTQWVHRLGGTARRFTCADGDLTTPEGQRQLWNILQQEQPRHVWMAPDCRLWCSWSRLNAARSPACRERLKQQRVQEQTHLRLCAKVFEWQRRHGREFHLEQPASSQMLTQDSLKPIVQGTQKITVHMCAFGLQTPVTKQPIKKAAIVLSTCRPLIRSLVLKQCSGLHHHAPLAGKPRELKGLSTTQFAGTYCKGFAQHIAKQVVSRSPEAAFALDANLPMTRKRFKTSLGTPSAQSSVPAQKRVAESAPDEHSRGQPSRRVEPATTLAPAELPFEAWKPVFQVASQCTTRGTTTLVSPQSDLIELLQSRIPEVKLLQVFVGRGSRNLQSPLGALPQTVAPIRFSAGSRTDKHTGKETFWCLGKEGRLSMTPERKRLRIEPVNVLITVFAQPAVSRESQPAEQTPQEPQASDPAVTSSSSLKPDIEAWGPPPVPIHGPAFRNLSKEEKSTLIRAHNNLGHPAPQTFANHLRSAGAPQNLIQGALEYQCDSCLESIEPRLQRPSKLPEPREFNDLVGVDGFLFKSRSGYKGYVLHALDEASCFHMGRRTPSRHTAQALEALTNFWFVWAGNPRKIYLDPAGEFRSSEILDHFQGLDIQTFVTAAAWQRGRLERHGDVLKDILHRMDIQMPLANDSLFDQALVQAIQAKNALVRFKGYSPEQIVLGKSLRIPGSITSDESMSSHAISEGMDLEAELHKQRLELRCMARKAFWEADNSETIRRAMLRRSHPMRGPFHPGDWVLYWARKTSPNRLASGRWHGPGRVICQEGSSVVWISHGTTVLRCPPENVRPASLREWQHAASSEESLPTKNAGGANAYLDLTGSPTPVPPSSVQTSSETTQVFEAGVPSGVPSARPPEDDLGQPEQELTPQVSQTADGAEGNVEVEREPDFGQESAAPSVPSALPDNVVSNPVDVPVPGSDEGLLTETIYLASEDLGISDDKGDNLFTFTHLEASGPNSGPPLAEDGLPFVEEPLTCSEQQAFCLEIPMKAKSYQRCLRAPREQMSLLATISKRAKSEVYLKDLSAQERQLFDQAKDKEIQCWLQTSAIKAVLRRSLNPEQILRSRWILTWKSPEPGESQRKAKARLVVLGFQDPKLVEVMRDAPTLSREGRAIVLQSVASSKFTLTSFDIKTAFLRGKADANNPLAMEPPVELRRALNLKDSEVCQLLGNAYGRVDAPLLFYKELCKQLLALGFTRHPLEPCVFMLYTEQQLSGVLGMHVDDGVGGGDARFNAKLQELAKTLPFGSRKSGEFVFTGIHLQQLPDHSIKASQSSYVQNIPQIDIGRPRRLTPEALITEPERTKLRGLVGSLQYAVTHTRPDVAAKLGEVQGQITTATVQTLLLANKVLREAQEYHQVCTYYLPIKPEELTFVSFGDASFASSKNLNSHQGALVCATDSRLNQNVEAPLSPLAWVSKKIPRVVRSTLSAEAYAMSKAVDLLGWLRALWGVIHVSGFAWQKPEQSFKMLNPAIVVTDCKSLYDLVTRLAMPSCEEYRTTLEVLLIKQRCEENTFFRWIPTTLQAADSLTKPMDASLLRVVLSQSRFKLYDSDNSLDKSAQRQQAVRWISQGHHQPDPSQ